MRKAATRGHVAYFEVLGTQGNMYPRASHGKPVASQVLHDAVVLVDGSLLPGTVFEQMQPENLGGHPLAGAPGWRNAGKPGLAKA